MGWVRDCMETWGGDFVEERKMEGRGEEMEEEEGREEYGGEEG